MLLATNIPRLSEAGAHLRTLRALPDIGNKRSHILVPLPPGAWGKVSCTHHFYCRFAFPYLELLKYYFTFPKLPTSCLIRLSRGGSFVSTVLIFIEPTTNAAEVRLKK